MDLVKLCSKALGSTIVTINEEEAMEEVLQLISNIPIKRFVEWLTNGINAIPGDPKLIDLLEDEEKYDEIMDDVLNFEDLIDAEVLAGLKEKLGRKEEEG